jgi:hypothetical protein
MDISKYPSIPSEFWSYYQTLREKRKSHPLLAATSRQGDEKTLDAINELFEVTCRNTGLKEKLFLNLGFDENNFDNNHLQSILGVMRAINTLNDLGFKKITPLPPRKSRREADLLAVYMNKWFAVEVFRSNEVSYRFPDHSNKSNNLQSYIAQRYSEKRSQLDATMREHQCDKAVLTVVIDSQPAKALVTGAEWEGVTEATYKLMGSPSKIHLLLFTGMKNYFSGKDEYAVYPPLDS